MIKARTTPGGAGVAAKAIGGRAISGLRAALLLAGTTAVLAACMPGSNPLAGPSKDAASTPKTQRSTRIVDRDVEAPQVFQVTETALWDGRPSLGGVWVASPDAKDPERVIMRNPTNGKFVIGALFRREIDNPGPKLQISSDAADALGLLAGAPGKISVTALRREEAADATPATPILDTAEVLPTTAAPAVSPAAIDGGGVATTALAPAPAATPAPSAAITAAATGALNAAPPPTAQSAPVPASGGRPIQIGFFSVEANASRAVETLSKAGITAGVRKESSNGKDYWSVTARGSAEMLQKIKSAGFSDAYLLK